MNEGNPKFDLYTATPEEITAQVDQTMRNKNNNAVSKLRELSELRWASVDENRLMLNWIDFDRRGRTPEVIAAHKRYAQAEIDWLVANPGDDLDEKTIALWLDSARKDLPTIQELNAAVQWVEEVEEYSKEHPECVPSETLKKLWRKRDSFIEDARRHLHYAIRLDAAEFLDALNTRNRRSLYKFRVEDTRDYRERKNLQLRDVWQRGKVLIISFDHAIKACRTLREAKWVCRIFHAPVTSQQREGATFLIGDGFEIIPT